MAISRVCQFGRLTLFYACLLPPIKSWNQYPRPEPWSSLCVYSYSSTTKTFYQIAKDSNQGLQPITHSEQETKSYSVLPRFLDDKFPRAQNISTLDPSRLVASDFIECKDHWNITVRYCCISMIFCRYSRVPEAAFPPETRGFLYLHRPDGVHPCAATLRFRICDKSLHPRNLSSEAKTCFYPKTRLGNLTCSRCSSRSGQGILGRCLLLDQLLSVETISRWTIW
ncbi:hypothetical protein BDP27DRAFT_175027 [Rhodocollybia butyracea]|uniref:Uncharacterized protein n=1 Tax=Rhodocollybia butyracea TaxID=206335 RepID=A0A9P5TWD1_9AGAR|nr:hypothetical protein BDP27DRAFT_175027 [Rhodocollybia butyracea]